MAKAPATTEQKVKVEYNDLGFVKNYCCPKCGSEVKPSHKDDIGTQFFKCEKCDWCGSQAKSKAREKFERKMRAYDWLLHPAGGLTDTFVYEPIGNDEYVYHTKDNKKGFVRVNTEYENPMKKREPRYFILIEDGSYYFSKKPSKEWLFKFPKRETLNEWIEGEKPSLPLKQLWQLTQIYFKTFLDFPHDYEFPIATLFVVESWLAELLPVVFYLMVKGEFGGGKTVTAEAITAICRHGYETGNLSPPFVARSIESQKLTMFVDELDSVAGTKDSDLYSIFRQGYRRSGTYSRIHPETLEPQCFNVFGAKLYSVHTEIEQALQTRTIPIHIRETGEPEYPVVNMDVSSFSELLRVEWFLWYLDNVLMLRDNRLETLDALSMLNLESSVAQVVTVVLLSEGVHSENNVDSVAEKIRKAMFKKKVAPLKNRQLEQLKQLTGRNTELGFLCFTFSNLVGIDLDKQIMLTFAQKLVEEGERTEVGFLGTLRDILREIYLEKQHDQDFITESKMVKVSNMEVYNNFNKKLKDEYGAGVSPHKFKEYLTEFGFTDAINRKKMKIKLPDSEEIVTRVCNIFTPRVLRKLDIEPTPQAKLPQSLTIQETLVLLRAKWQKGYPTDFDKLLVEIKGCELNEAEQLREKWLDEGLLAIDPDGRLVWT